MPITSPLGWWFRILQLASKSPTSLGLETSCRYMNQSRTILFNLKDPKNQTFSSKLLKGGGWVVGRAGRHLKEWCVTVLAVGFYTWRCHSWEMQVPSRSTVDAITQDRSCKLKKVTVKNYIYIYTWCLELKLLNRSNIWCGFSFWEWMVTPHFLVHSTIARVPFSSMSLLRNKCFRAVVFWRCSPSQ